MKFLTFLPAVFLYCVSNSVLAQSSQEIIKINQSGFYTMAPKIAIVASDYTEDEYAGKNFGFYIFED